jgi:CDP-diacylglycerol--glycerol-3-phosphate 3-phosphatidyltransferase
MSSINLPNRLTLIRVALVPLFLLLLSFDNVFTHFLALITFIAAAITDYYDGKIARERSIETDFGRLMDPLADKILVCAAFIYFVGSYPRIPAWIVTIIIGREFAVSGIRMLAASKGKIVASDKFGKLKTIAQLTSIITILNVLFYIKVSEVVPALSYWEIIKDWVNILIYVLVGITLVMTVVSGWNYLIANKRLFWESMRSPGTAGTD